jgi:hypothetical protein
MSISRRIGWICVAMLLLAGWATAQDSKKTAQLRTVRGNVSDKSENPIPGSLVFLKNLRTNSVSSRYVDDDGNYRFSGLDPNVDYEVHAEADGAKSPSRTVTSLDSRKEIVLNLKIDRKTS